MRALKILILFCFSSIASFSQESVISWSPLKLLNWDDFSGKAKDTSKFDAEACAEVKYYYQFNSPHDFKFNVVASFNKNTSWCKREHASQDLLEHEQLHFDIAELYARKIKEMFENYNYSRNFSYEISRLFNQKKAEYHAMQRQYDEETNHSLNKNKQQDWEIFIQDELSKWHPKQELEQSVAKSSLAEY